MQCTLFIYLRAKIRNSIDTCKHLCKFYNNILHKDLSPASFRQQVFYSLYQYRQAYGFMASSSIATPFASPEASRASCHAAETSSGISNLSSGSYPSCLSAYTFLRKIATTGSADAAPWAYAMEEKCMSLSSPPTQAPKARLGV